MIERLVVVGSRGFLAREFLHQSRLDESVGQIITVDRRLSEYRDKLADGFQFSNSDEMIKIVENVRPTHLINFIGSFSSDHFSDMLYINAEISRLLLECLVNDKCNIQKIVLIGSAAEYGRQKTVPILESAKLNPTNYYGLSKSIQSSYFKYYFHQHDLPVCLARTFNVIGRGMNTNLAIPSFIRRLKILSEKETLKVGNIQTIRDYTDSIDVADAYLRVLKFGRPGEVYNICSGIPTRMADIVDALISLKDFPVEIESIDEHMQSGDIETSYGCNNLAEQDLGWRITRDLHLSLKEMYEYEQ